jgi:3-keto-5-aminohexanoate cleavage enzyme
MNAIAVAAGGGVRVGLEDNIWCDPNRTKLARNADLIRRIHRLAEVNERKIMAPSQLRELLHLENGYGRYGRKYSKEMRASESYDDNDGM